MKKKLSFYSTNCQAGVATFAAKSQIRYAAKGIVSDINVFVERKNEINAVDYFGNMKNFKNSHQYVMFIYIIL